MSGETVDLADGGGIDSAIALIDGGTPGGREGGVPEACSGALQQTRLRFEQAQVAAPAVCKSETQTRTCSGGTFGAWSGTFQAETCEPSRHNSCGGVMHGEQETRTRYAMAVAASVYECKAEQQTRTCDDGNFAEWTGRYQAESCVVGFLGGCLLVGGDFACESGTTCMVQLPISVRCLGGLGHSCAGNGECVTGTCVAGSCTLKSAPGGACDEPSDCASCVGSNTAVSCPENTCRCFDAASCTANNQCLGTCVSNKCVPANTTCDPGDQADCRMSSVCVNKSGTNGCYLPDGELCTSNSSCEQVCRGGLCAPAGASGEVCDENVDCAAGLTCRAGACAALVPFGDACEETADCQQSEPKPLVCAPYEAESVTYQVCLVAQGGLCERNVYCASGACSGSGSGSNHTCK